MRINVRHVPTRHRMKANEFIRASPRNAKYVNSLHCDKQLIGLTLLRIDYAINNKLTPFISMQNHYSLVYREEEREMFPTLKVCSWRLANTVEIDTDALQLFGVGSIPWSPLARGLLTRPLNEKTIRGNTDGCVNDLD